MEVEEEVFLSLSPPSEYNCVNCSVHFNATVGAVNEIHIYSAGNEFERSITILDSLSEMFMTKRLAVAQSCNFNFLMCSKCAETVSYLYKYYLNFISLSTATSYICQLISQIENLHHSTKVEPNIPMVFDLEFCGDEDESFPAPDVQYSPHARDSGSAEEPVAIAEASLARKKKKRKSKCIRTRIRTQQLNKSTLNRDKQKRIATCKSRRVRDSREIVKPRLFNCHHLSCDHTERFNFKIHEHIFLVHEKKEMTVCTCGFKYYPQIFKSETHRCKKESKTSKKINLNVHLCEICGTLFKGKKMLWHHIERIHVSSDILFTCQRAECGRKFATRRQLVFHIDIHQETRCHLCSECGRTFKLRSTLMKHLEVHTLPLEERIRMNRSRIDRTRGPLGRHECKICHRVYSRQLYLDEHMTFKHDSANWKYTCPVCKKPVSGPQRLENHIKSHDPGYLIERRQRKNKERTDSGRYHKPIFIDIDISKPFVCFQCNKKFKYKAFLLTHQKAEHGMVTRKGTTITPHTQEELLPVIVNQQTEETTYCNSSDGKSDEALRLKMKKEETESAMIKMTDELFTIENPDPTSILFVSQPDKKKKWKCDECEKTFTQSRALARHYMNHTGEAQKITFLCPFRACENDFDTKLKLGEHLRTTHPVDQVQVLPEEELKKLKLDVETIVKKKKFQCHVCSKFFTDKKYLSRHVLGHSGAHKKLPCPLCEYKTSTRSLLKSHMRSNHKERIPYEEKTRFSCDICQKIFASERNLREHKLIHTGEIFRFTCPVPFCEAIFRSKTSQQSHTWGTHPETLTEEELDRWKCPECQKRFNCRKNLTEHRRMHKGLHLRETCHICGIKLRHKKALTSHIRAKHEKETKPSTKSPASKPKFTKGVFNRKTKKRKEDEKEITKTSRGRPRKHPLFPKAESLEVGGNGLGEFWRCDFCHRSFSSRRLKKKDHMRQKHPTQHSTASGNSNSYGALVVVKSEENETERLFGTVTDVMSLCDSLETKNKKGVLDCEFITGKKLVVKVERLTFLEDLS